MKNLEEEKNKRNKLADELMADEGQSKSKKPNEEIRKGGEQGNNGKKSIVEGKKEMEEVKVSLGIEEQTIDYRDLRKEISMMKKATLKEADRESFIEIVRTEKLISFNFSTYLLCYSEGFSKKESRKEEVPCVWWPKHERCED
ncbi:hypothetical protein GOP47_0026314 [Adiantum capillus-veneris]|nr:hypothetical protein GOP47_0026314 [Adiantum capillus-veneris]